MSEVAIKEAPVQEDTRPLKTYRILRGVHADKTFEPVSLVEIEGIERLDLLEKLEDGTFGVVERDVPRKTAYYPGDVIRCRKDLERQNNPVDKRVERLNEYEPINAAPVEDAISGFTVPELKVLAEEQEIDLSESTLKADILRVIRAELVGRVAVTSD